MGASYNYYHIDWFGEFGALFQQVQYQVSSPLIEGSLNGDTLALNVDIMLFSYGHLRASGDLVSLII